MEKQLNWWVVEGYYVYVIQLFDIVLPSKIRKELRKCINYRGNSAVKLVKQRINNEMYCQTDCTNNYPIILKHDDQKYENYMEIEGRYTLAY